MIRFFCEAEDGTKLIGLGLSRRNCELLLEHKPIEVDIRKDFNIPWKGKIILLADETEERLEESLRGMINEETKIERR